MLAARKWIACGTAVTALAVGLAGCSGSGSPESGAAARSDTDGGALGAKKGPPKSALRLIGDGSTAYTGAQPGIARPERLKPGQKPPQFVVFSWDGAGEDSQRLFSHFRDVGRKYDAKMTYFLSGVYLLPKDKSTRYSPPQHAPGRSDIGFNDTEGIRSTLRELRGAWQEGNEIGTHFNGHFCGADGGVGGWSVEEWESEIAQAKEFVKNWKTNSGLKTEAPLPFDYEKELVGARTPCLEGQQNMMRAARTMGFRYDSSGVGNQVWPKKTEGMWDIPLQLVPVPGRKFETLSMDYNFMFNQSKTVNGDPSKHEYWGNQMRDGLLQGFDRAYKGNRAPLIIGNHFESWNGGTYMRAVEETIKTVCVKDGVRCVTFKQLVDWLDAQDPRTLERLRGLGVGQKPTAGWQSYLTAAEPASAPVPPAAPAGPDGNAGAGAETVPDADVDGGTVPDADQGADTGPGVDPR
ncbi:hypothetical protein OG875_13250 [Streptomyces sp. NBC_01498]|uniref:hypothetical protein n=1 Tax=Streptomyces sp. NBC_01498 TaxID=2975870 RepID=UPI002E7BEDF4|nr:hypothetical protein [Streptomyces sp. NBC_01498]WTL25473.1 hypothetical protein OG875_13250 [Streptomyces sp. NBC_01498]